MTDNIEKELVLCPICNGEGKVDSYRPCYFCLGDEIVSKDKREEWWRNQYDKIWDQF